MIRLRAELRLWWRALLRAAPGDIGIGLRRRFSGLAACGPSVRILEGVTLYYPERLRLGKSVGIAAGCQINAAGGLTIGDGCLIGPGSVVWTQSHRYTSAAVPIQEQGYEQQPVLLEPDCWLAAGSVILPGVTLGRGTVVAAGAVVTKSTEPYSIVAGVPARAIGQRSSTSLSRSGCLFPLS